MHSEHSTQPSPKRGQSKGVRPLWGKAKGSDLFDMSLIYKTKRPDRPDPFDTPPTDSHGINPLYLSNLGSLKALADGFGVSAHRSLFSFDGFLLQISQRLASNRFPGKRDRNYSV